MRWGDGCASTSGPQCTCIIDRDGNIVTDPYCAVCSK